MQVYTTKMDQMVKAITIIIHCAILPVPFYLWLRAGWQMALHNVLLLALVFVSAYVFRPFLYELHSDKIVVRKSIFPKVIELDKVASISKVEYKDLKVRLRLWGSGGLWGWYGIFLSSGYGTINMQCSERDNLILIETQEQKQIVLSPLDRENFFRQLQQQLKEKKQSNF